MHDYTTYDFIGIGIGPFNLGLACLTAPIKELNGLFLDKAAGFDWHPGMMLQDAHLQTPFLSDLVTLADPTSSFTFLNYLKEQRRIYSFYIRENFFLLRREYNQYCQWAVSKLPNVRFQTEVHSIQYSKSDGCYLIHACCTQTGATQTYRAKRLVLGTGPNPYVPACCEPLMGHALHSSNYLARKQDLQSKESITVMGSGQSAAEVFYDLLQDIDDRDYALNWITRSPRFLPLEYTKLTLEMTSPEYVDYFYDLPADKRTRLNREQKNLYKGINGDLINAIYDLLYTKSLWADIRVKLLTNSELTDARFNHSTGRFELALRQHEQEKSYRHHTQGLILATGYHYRVPPFVEGIADRIRWDDQGWFDVHRHYTVDHDDREIFVQNAELPTHGFVTPDLGMACYRNSCIIREMTGREHYPIEDKIAFQAFAAPEENGSPKTAPHPAKSAWS
ncbi:lysine N(6)-hydroxylase/L-ornithine N(5)-oxygenase family protein [Methylohalobius crimeensis]|uniref:lysine N(6)-hydroxylase/L-ornithine N(5)-oxygenase family protein n=1 Tax=Methylohalobius crimeensis TaxID=244365 RepID=UPI0003B5A855|nr:lysine N(6)-hydroxylase/L-ornithine N(5)-oxygenase family protein [Methylohalobius crimeensis]